MAVVVLQKNIVVQVACEFSGVSVVPRDFILDVFYVITGSLPAISVLERFSGVGEVREP